MKTRKERQTDFLTAKNYTNTHINYNVKCKYVKKQKSGKL